MPKLLSIVGIIVGVIVAIALMYFIVAVGGDIAVQLISRAIPACAE